MGAKKQIWACATFIALAIIYLVCTAFIPVVNVFGVTVVSSATIPRILGVMLLFLSSIQCIKSIGEYKAEKKAAGHVEEEQILTAEQEGKLDVKAALAEAEANEENAETDVISIVETIACLAIFALLMKPLGFLISAFLYMVLQMTVLTKRAERKKKFIFIVILSAVISAAVYYLFTKGLSLMLPAGILG